MKILHLPIQRRYGCSKAGQRFSDCGTNTLCGPRDQSHFTFDAGYILHFRPPYPVLIVAEIPYFLESLPFFLLVQRKTQCPAN
ncbi:hypothetical protein D3C81_2160860 [compost metagenome]